MSAAVIYHYPCADGAFAALAAHLYFSAVKKTAIFYPNLVHNPLRIKDVSFANFEAVYLLDMVGPEGFVNELCSTTKRVVILDHHLTAMKRFKENEYTYDNIHCVIDMKRSAATIAFDYFTKELQSEKGLPLVQEQNRERIHMLFKYVEDADLWTWKLPDSKAFSIGLKNLEIEMSATKNEMLFERLLELDSESIIDKGKESMLVTEMLIAKILESAFVISLGNGCFGQCLAVEIPERLANHRSDLGNALACKSRDSNLRPIGAVVYNVETPGDGSQFKVSLRSLGTEDTTKISEAYNGGGHLNASSFLINKEDYEQWKI